MVAELELLCDDVLVALDRHAAQVIDDADGTLAAKFAYINGVCQFNSTFYLPILHGPGRHTHRPGRSIPKELDLVFKALCQILFKRIQLLNGIAATLSLGRIVAQPLLIQLYSTIHHLIQRLPRRLSCHTTGLGRELRRQREVLLSRGDT